MFLLLVVIILVLVCLGGRMRSVKDLPSYPGWLPVIGHLHLLLGYEEKKLWTVFKQICDEATRRGGVMAFYLGPSALTFVSDPEDVQLVSRYCQEKHYMYDMAKPWLGNGLLTADTATWKITRKVMNLAFTPQMLNGFMSVFNSQAQRLTTQFEDNPERTFVPHTMLTINNLETICLTSIAFDPQKHKELFERYRVAISNIFALLVQRFLRFWLQSPFIYKFSKLKTQTDMVIKDLHNLSNTVIQKRKAIIESKEHLVKEDQFRPLMDIILELSKEKGLSDRQVREEMDTIIFGGHDTTANTLTFALMLLGSDLEKQEKVYQEIIEVMGHSDRDVEKEDLLKLVYLEKVIKETLRLYPIAPAFPRVSTSELKIKTYTFPAGSTFVVDAFNLHRHSVWGPDAEEFKPERWEKLDSWPKEYMPFGVGRRTCIGKMYAMMSMKISLAHLLRRFKVTSDISKLTLKMDSLLRPESGHVITLELRK
ncbi:unnamed protein product [Chrysodeixis includens]|uniref:Cytochrome P450 n=1 Tax=Chrysodeixis includens TaxID=689277 RepID=A0A9P0FU79_CHRIL|nr:unnamed protein product [Chrysodeixis includens]